MKKTIVIVLAVLVLLIGVAVAVPFFVPTGIYTAKISEAVKSATGRTLTLGGDVGFSLFPSVGVTAQNVAFANAPGAAEANMATLKSLEVRLKVMPLISGQIEVESFVLVEPMIRLEIDKQGRANWTFDQAKAAPAEPGKPTQPDGPAIGGLTLEDVRIENGRILYADARSGLKEEVKDVDMTVSLPSLDKPLKAKGGLVWHDKKIDLDVSAEKPGALIAGGASPAAISVAGDPLKFAFTGTVANGPRLKVDGALDLDVPSVRALAAWAGKPIEAPGETLGPLTLKGTVAVDGATYAVKDADIRLDAIAAKGAVNAATGGAKPVVKGKLDVGDLDLNPYLPPEAKDAKPTPSQASGPAAGGAPATWSEAPMDMSGLKAADVDFDLTVKSILAGKVRVGQSALGLKIKDGRLTADLKEMALYQGTGKGTVSLDASGAVPTMRKTFALSGVQAQPFLKDAADFGRLSGTAKADFELTAKGASQKAMVESLNGKGALAFENGAITGINVAAMIRNAANAFLDPSAGETRQTDFSELGGTFVITNGILKNDDLELKSPLLRVGGAGTADLPKRTVNYRITPKLAATTQGQGGAAEVSGITVPVIVSGPWHALSYRPDLEGAIKEQIKDPAKAMEAIKNLRSGTKPEELLRGLIPGGQAPADSGPAPAQEAPKPNPLDALKGLIERR
ncbi:AsmA family protein [Shumkonia mesophila]|uniref:AsmA family protein n=1 Tax=Shumkonia mesophila TaxID=2838854 RepID=UPI002934BE4B|nr:AsmA family protein [Shumkonia mesophila]